jgi:hypothetical protein
MPLPAAVCLVRAGAAREAAQRARGSAAVAAHCLSSSSPPTPAPVPATAAASASAPGPLVRRLNHAFTAHPRASLVCLLSAEALSLYGAHALLVAAHVDVPASFAVAFALSRTLRRARLPAELAGAAFLARVAPALASVRVTALLDAVPRWPRRPDPPPQPHTTDTLTAPVPAAAPLHASAPVGTARTAAPPVPMGNRTASASAPALGPMAVPVPVPMSAPVPVPVPESAAMPAPAPVGGRGWAARAAGLARITVDRYGAAYFLSARYLGVAIVLSLYAAVAAGADPAPFLARLGVPPAVGSTLGTWAAAVTLASAAYPFTVLAAATVAPPLGRTATALLRRLRG